MLLLLLFCCDAAAHQNRERPSRKKSKPKRFQNLSTRLTAVLAIFWSAVTWQCHMGVRVCGWGIWVHWRYFSLLSGFLFCIPCFFRCASRHSVDGRDAFPVVQNDKYLGFDMIISSFSWHGILWCNIGGWWDNAVWFEVKGLNVILKWIYRLGS